MTGDSIEMADIDAVDSPVALITGVTGPVGRSVARRLAAQGARLAMVGRDRARLDTMAAELAAALSAMPGVDAAAAAGSWTKVVGDVRDAEAARAVAATVEARYGRIDALVHLVGGWAGGTPVVDLDPAEVRGLLDRHLWSTLNVAQAVVPGMIARGFGRMVAVSSPVASTPVARQAGYAIAKSSEEVLLRSLARELAGTGVTANVVTIRGLADDPGGDPGVEVAPRKMGMATPDEIAEVIAFLASRASATINGERITLGTG